METKITKQIAGILYGYGYQLQDNEGKIFGIHLITENTLGIYGSKVNDDKYIKFSEIGSTYKILAYVLKGYLVKIYLQSKLLYWLAQTSHL